MTGRFLRTLGLLACLGFLALACSKSGVSRKAIEGDPNRRLAELLSQIEENQAAGSECYDVGDSPIGARARPLPQGPVSRKGSGVSQSKRCFV